MGDFDYSSFPAGYYDQVAISGPGIQRAWHNQKFQRVRAILELEPAKSLLDIGCFAGTFLASLLPTQAATQVGVDIVESQILYANSQYQTPFRSFKYFENIKEIEKFGNVFDTITLIEVIEHLSEDELQELFKKIDSILAPGGRLIMTTPNYHSAWPVLEILVKWFSKIDYSEQHLTKFNFAFYHRKLKKICPEVFDNYNQELLTTSHFIAPFLAPISYSLSMNLSKSIDPKSWKNPFGPLLLSVFRKSGTD